MSSHEDAISIYGRQKLAIEKLFDPKRDVVLRSGLIMGNGGIVRQMAQFMRTKHAVPLIGGGKQPLQVIGVYDLACLIEKAASSDIHGRFVSATPQVYTYKQFYQALARALHIKVVYVPLPYALLLAAFKIAATLRLPLGVGEDNLMGLKMLRSMESEQDLQKLGIQLDDLPTILSKISIK
jgi:nucleoside-diphosphate-sugar epimerase